MTECDVCSGAADLNTPRRREELLPQLVPGDMFQATVPQGAVMLCVVTGVGESTIEARRLLVPQQVQFCRKTGTELDGSSRIDAIAPPPIDIYSTIMNLDRRHRLGHRPDNAKLRAEEIEALSLLDNFYEENALP